MQLDHKMYGYYSRKADLLFGSLIYLDYKGDYVNVTAIGKTVVPKDSGYIWDDAECIGFVDKFVKSNIKRLIST